MKLATMADESALPPVTLTGYPSSLSALAWSEEHLAITLGDAVCILTPNEHVKSSQRQHDYWHTESVQTNQFKEEEWPFQELTTLQNLSLGEEQSESIVTSLEWSPPGLGFHRRPVLAVLTSNLVLSLWESNGSPGSWNRVAVINRYLSGSKNGSNDFRRRAQRIRCFAWLPPLKLPTTTKWGVHLLLTIDDSNLLSCIRVEGHQSIGKPWIADLVHQEQLSAATKPTWGERMSPLQAALARQSLMTHISVGKWQLLRDDDGSAQLYRMRLTLSRAASTVSPQEFPYLLELEPTDTGLDVRGRSLSPNATPSYEVNLSNKDFESSIADLLKTLDSSFELDGHHRTRFWGFAKQPGTGNAAACITLHPSDMLENLLASAERSNIVFQRLPAGESPSPISQLELAPLRILRWIAHHAKHYDAISGLDQKLVSIASSAIGVEFSDDLTLMDWAKVIRDRPMIANGQMDVNGDTTMIDAANDTPSLEPQSGISGAAVETCEICGDTVSMSLGLAHAACARGHRYVRCGLSFLAIQKPGISKYCSRCGLEFLDLPKLETQGGPSLSWDLFQEFDVCPYCQGKFRR